MSQVYMTAKLNLADGTILYPQVSLDNIVTSISDPTLVTVATTTNGKVPVTELPVVTVVGAQGSNNNIPTEAAVRALADTKQSTLVAGTGTEIINGSTINAMAVNLNDVVVNNVPNNGLYLEVEGNTMSVVSPLAANDSAGVIAGATNGVKLVNGVVQVDVADGLKIEEGKAVIDDASVTTTLVGVTETTVSISGTTVPMVHIDGINDKTLTPGDLRGALSLGQAVDVCSPVKYVGNIAGVVIDGSTITTNITATLQAHYLDDLTILGDGTSSSQHWMGWYGSSSNRFPKGADGLRYLFVADVRNVGDAASAIRMVFGDYYLRGTDAVIASVSGGQQTFTRLFATAVCPPNNNLGGYLDWQPQTAGNKMRLDVWNFRQYEVTNLTEEAIDYLGKYGADPNNPVSPDALFRALSVFSVRNRYLIKNDMVCPWIYTIGMADNSDMTVAAGLSYKIKYTDNNSHLVTVDTIPTDAYGWDTHVQMFVKDASKVVFQSPLVLMDALSSNSGHNLSIKYRNGDALVYVDDKNAGKMVTLSTCSNPPVSGELQYFMTQNPGSGQSNYIIFGAPVNGVVCDFGTVSAQTWENDLIGNGTDLTFVSGTLGTGGVYTNMQDLTIRDSVLTGTGTLLVKGVRIDGTIDLQETSRLVFSGTNVLDGTATMAPTALFRVIDKAKVTSTIPSGSSIGTGVINLSTENRMSLYSGIVLENLTLTGGNWTSDNIGMNSVDATFINCDITGNTSTGGNGTIFRLNGGLSMTFINCNIHDNVTAINADFWSYSGAKMVFDNTVFGAVKYTGIPVSITIRNACKGKIFNSVSDTGAIINIVNGASLTITGGNSIESYTLGRISIGNYAASGAWEPGGSASIVINDVTGSISGCTFRLIDTNGVLWAHTNIVCARMDAWSAENVIFGSPIDASKVQTVRLTGGTFNSASMISNAPNRIQLPANSANKFAHNSGVENTTNILQAPFIFVGNNPASPSGTASIVTLTGTTTYTGWGSYIRKDGASDFTTAITGLTTSDGLAAALGGSNKFIKLANNLVTSSVFADGMSVNKCLLTNEYDPILAGTYSITAGSTVSVNEATKLVTVTGALAATDMIICSGTTVSGPLVMNQNTSTISGGGTLVYTRRLGFGATSCVYTNITFTNNHTNTDSDGSVYRGCYGVTFYGCTFRDNAMYRGCIDVEKGTGNPPLIKDCTFWHNDAVGAGGIDLAVASDATAHLAGTIKTDGVIQGYGDAGTFLLDEGTVIDLTGSTVPATRTGAMYVGAYGSISVPRFCVVITADGQRVELNPGAYSSISKTGEATLLTMTGGTRANDLRLPGRYVAISGDNTLDATISGTTSGWGYLEIAANTSITSTIPEGETTGVGVISVPLNTVGGAPVAGVPSRSISNIALTGCTAARQPYIIHDIQLTNVRITNNNNTNANTGVVGVSGTVIMDNVYVAGNNSTVGFQGINGLADSKLTLRDCYIANYCASPYAKTLLTLDGTVELTGSGCFYWSGTNDSVRILNGTIIKLTSSTPDYPIQGAAGISVGHYEGTTWVSDGTDTASIIVNGGSPITISGSGTKISKTGVFS